MSAIGDPFGTAAIRAAQLAAWRADPQRLREDANAEEDHARGYYRDRVVLELLQNAADAAGQGGKARIVLETSDAGPATLSIANTGAPLTARGVRSLAGLRASAKVEQTSGEAVGAFGVGFAAVRSVADSILVASASGSIRFDLAAATRDLEEAGRDVGEIAELLAARGESLPVLRLPYRADDSRGRSAELPDDFRVLSAELPDGFATVVRLELRDDTALAAVREQLAALDVTILLAFDSLDVIEIDMGGAARELRDPESAWHVQRARGTWPPALVADLGIEQRERTGWALAWAVPRDPLAAGLAAEPHPVGAPTATDDLTTLPARLIATFPLDATRRRIRPGAMTDHLVREAARAYGELAARLATLGDGGSALGLVPRRLPAGPLDAALIEAVTTALREAPIVPGPPGSPRLSPSQALVLGDDVWRELSEPQAVRVWQALAHVEPALTRLPPGSDAARALDIDRAELADLCDRVATTWPEDRLADLYAALAPLVAGARGSQRAEELATLPIPLLGRRPQRGARGVWLLRDGDAPGEVLAVLGGAGLAIAGPEVSRGAAGDLLVALGARPAGVAELLADPELVDAIDEAMDEDLDLLADAVLGLVATLPPHAGGPRFAQLGRLVLRTADGEDAAAEELALPGTAAEQLFDRIDTPLIDPGLVARWGPDVLAQVGVRQGLTLLVGAARERADGWDEFAAESDVGDAAAIADLDLVRDDAWPLALREMAERPELRAAIVARPSYAAWWLRTRSPRELALRWPFALPALRGVGLRPAPAVVAQLEDEALLRAVGGVRSLAELDAQGWLAHLAGPDGDAGARTQGDLAEIASHWWRGLALLAAADLDAEPEVRAVPAMVDGHVRWVARESAIVADDGAWLQRGDLGPLLPAPTGLAGAVADLLDVPLASELARAHLDEEGAARREVPPAAALALPEVPEAWVECEELRLDGHDVDFWLVGPEREVHAATMAGLAAGLALRSGRPELRPAIETLLAGDIGPDELAAFAAWQAGARSVEAR